MKQINCNQVESQFFILCGDITCLYILQMPHWLTVHIITVLYLLKNFDLHLAVYKLWSPSLLSDITTSVPNIFVRTVSGKFCVL